MLLTNLTSPKPIRSKRKSRKPSLPVLLSRTKGKQLCGTPLIHAVGRTVAIVAAFAAAVAVQAEQFDIQCPSSVDGQPIHSRVSTPKSSSTGEGRVPLVLFFGGGEGGLGIPGILEGAAHSRGWMVAAVAGRKWALGRSQRPWGVDGSTCKFTFSMAYVDSKNPEIGPGRQDILDALDCIFKRYNVDEDRVYLTGFSLGGRGVWMIGLSAPDVFAAIAPLAAASDMFELDIRTAVTRDSHPCRMAIAGGPPGASDYSATMRKLQSGRFLIENAFNLPVFVAHGTRDALAYNIPSSERRQFLHGFHMTTNTQWSDCYTYSGREFCFGHTPTLSELHARHSDGYNYAYMYTAVPHLIDPNWLQGADPEAGAEGVADPDGSGRLVGILDFFAGRKRLRNPETIVYKSFTDGLRNAYWAAIDISKPWSGSPGAVRAKRILSENGLKVELARVAKATFDLERAGLALSADRPLRLLVAPLYESTFDPALHSEGEPLEPVIVLKGRFDSIPGITVLKDGQALSTDLIELRANTLTFGPIRSLDRSAEIVVQVRAR